MGTIVQKRPLRIKGSIKSFWIEYFGLLVVSVLFYIAWGFGLPAVHSLNLSGPVRLVFQVIFIIATIALGVLMFIFFCILSPDIREAWKSIFSRFVPGYSKRHTIGEHQNFKDMCMTDRNATGSNLKEEAVPEISFMFADTTFENPVAANVHEDSKPVTASEEEGAEVTDDEDTDSYIKMDLAAAAVPDNPAADDQKQSSN